MRSWSNETYLWSDEITDIDPEFYTVPEYFSLLKTNELSDTGNIKDKFHFTVPTDEWELSSQSGESFGYGMNISLQNRSGDIPRQVTVTYSESNSPASEAGVTRGAIVVSIDGVNVENADNNEPLINSMKELINKFQS